MTAWLNPDCAAGKHAPSCAGDAWDEDHDTRTDCACSCHEPVDPTLARLLALGVPYYLAVEAIASTALDRDEDDGGAHTRRARTHEATGRPSWLQDDPDGLRIVDRD